MVLYVQVYRVPGVAAGRPVGWLRGGRGAADAGRRGPGAAGAGGEGAGGHHVLFREQGRAREQGAFMNFPLLSDWWKFCTLALAKVTISIKYTRSLNCISRFSDPV